MLTTSSRSWWVVLVRGIIAVLFGLAALIHPTAAVGALAWVFGAYALTDGVIALVAAFQLSSHDNRWLTLIVSGIVGIVVGIIALFMTGAAVVAVVYVIASWAMLTGILEVVAAIQLRKAIKSEFYLIASGVISILLGLVLFAWPLSAVVILAYFIGWYALFYGVSLIGLGFRLRHHGTSNVSRMDERIV